MPHHTNWPATVREAAKIAAAEGKTLSVLFQELVTELGPCPAPPDGYTLDPHSDVRWLGPETYHEKWIITRVWNSTTDAHSLDVWQITSHLTTRHCRRKMPFSSPPPLQPHPRPRATGGSIKAGDTEIHPGGNIQFGPDLQITPDNGTGSAAIQNGASEIILTPENPDYWAQFTGGAYFQGKVRAAALRLASLPTTSAPANLFIDTDGTVKRSLA
ncbi:hypothetical protein LN996_04665 [Arthrobacter sp. AK01]|uniref:hypothetical protein n=1 Tax=Arthrobacter sp. AK01 TaxID=2894084 RepID=UPI001E31B3F0|nr:hypothetical protein [Arthrobacter sp. AK01]MCD4850093.1 hypothetical protein [Arthrobacter sp. AK01]